MSDAAVEAAAPADVAPPEHALDPGRTDAERRLFVIGHMPAEIPYHRVQEFFALVRPYVAAVVEAHKKTAAPAAAARASRPGTGPAPTGARERRAATAAAQAQAPPPPEEPVEEKEEEQDPAITRAFMDLCIDAILNGTMDQLVEVVFNRPAAEIEGLTADDVAEAVYFFYVRSMSPFRRTASIVETLASRT